MTALAGTAGHGGDGGHGEVGAEACSNAVFCDDFDTDPLASDAPRWTITNYDEHSWQWYANSTLSTGPGMSCSWIGYRSAIHCDGAHVALDPLCEEGVALIHSPPFAVGDGKFTIDLDLLGYVINVDDQVTTAVQLHKATEGGWAIDPETCFSYLTNQDFMAQFVLVPVDAASVPEMNPRRHVFTSAATRAGYDVDFEYVEALDHETWYHLHFQVCRDELRALLTERDTGTPVFERTRVGVEVSPGADYQDVYLQLVGEGPAKQFDNVVVRRGCD